MCNRDDATHRECITWSADDTSFWVSNIETFSRMILPMYFKHNNYASFVRQLNMYGFHRSTEPRGKVELGSSMIEHFTHENFVKGREDLLDNIHRKTSSNFTKASKRDRMQGRPGPAADRSIASLSLAKEAKHVQQQINEQEDARLRMQEDVDVLKKNQMQLANTIQMLHQQNVSLQREMIAQNERLESVIAVLTGHNVQIDPPASSSNPNASADLVKRQRQLALDRDQAKLQQEARDNRSSTSESTDYGSHVHQIDDDTMDLQSMDLDNLFNTMDGPPMVPLSNNCSATNWS